MADGIGMGEHERRLRRIASVTVVEHEEDRLLALDLRAILRDLDEARAERDADRRLLRAARMYVDASAPLWGAIRDHLAARKSTPPPAAP